MRCFWFVLSCYSALCGIPAQTDRQPKQLFQSQTEQKTIQPTDCATVHGQILLVHAPSQLVCKLCSVHTSHSTDVLSVHWFLRSSNGIMQHFSNVQSRFLSLSLCLSLGFCLSLLPISWGKLLGMKVEFVKRCKRLGEQNSWFFWGMKRATCWPSLDGLIFPCDGLTHFCQWTCTFRIGLRQPSEKRLHTFC